MTVLLNILVFLQSASPNIVVSYLFRTYVELLERSKETGKIAWGLIKYSKRMGYWTEKVQRACKSI